MKRLKLWSILAVITGIFMFVNSSWASGAFFIIKANGIELGGLQKRDGKGNYYSLPTYKVRMESGKSFTLIAQGMVETHRAGSERPFEPEAGAWLFDDEFFELQGNTGDIKPQGILKNDYSKTAITVNLQALKSGQSRIRFVGKIFNYYHKFDIFIEILDQKK